MYFLICAIPSINIITNPADIDEAQKAEKIDVPILVLKIEAFRKNVSSWMEIINPNKYISQTTINSIKTNKKFVNELNATPCFFNMLRV